MSEDRHIYQQPLLSESSLDHGSDLTIAEEKAALGDAYQQKVTRARKLRAGMLIGSLILNLVLFLSLASLFVRFRSRVEWKGVPQVWSTSSLLRR